MRHSKRSLEGEILIDHRASPGISAEDARWMGIDPAYVTKGQIVESPVINCSHCQATVVLNPDRTRERAWCSKCDKYICDECAFVLHRTLECRTVEKRIDQAVDAIERFGSSPLLLPHL